MKEFPLKMPGFLDTSTDKGGGMQALVLTLLMMGVPQDLPEASGKDEGWEDAAMHMATCAGYWDFLSDTAKAAGKPAVAEQLHNMGNGAETAALYFLSSQHLLAGGKPRTYGSWKTMTDPKRESGKLRMMGLAEMNDQETIELEGNLCLESAKVQEQILQNMRRSRMDEEANATP
ncbi:hypothetical protein [Stenotrophomonas sp. 59]|uniref:hypothetical protein n=1 Tax=Stenotrophomonas sp. 59 TaxID=3051120 RepID=UPI00256EC388|nr:hypothetical protein [Stenotrophomonas sp. 59]